MEVGRSLTGHGLTVINKASRRRKEKACDSVRTICGPPGEVKNLTALLMNKEVTDTMRKKLTVLNATVGYGPTSHGLAENKRTIDPRFSDR